MTEPENLLLEHLRGIRADLGALREEVDFLKQGQISLRNDVHDFRGDMLRFEQRTEQRLDRIEKRVSLADA